MSPQSAVQREIIAHVARALTVHSFPPLDVRTKAIFASQIGHLLRGGYRAEDIQRIATNLALDPAAPPFWSELSRIGQHVRRDSEEREESLHRMRKHDGNLPFSPEVAALIPPKGVTRPPEADNWSNRCITPSCPMTALYGRERCGTHEPKEVKA